MKNKDLTPQFTEHLLKSWQRADFSPDDLSRIAFLGNEKTLSLNTLELCLRETLYDWVMEELPTKCKETIETEQPDRLLNALKETFQFASTNEQSYMLIYCRYLALKKITVSELANQIGMSERNLRRYLIDGFKLLTLKLQAAQQKVDSIQLKKTDLSHFPAPETDQVIGIDPIISQISSWLAADTLPSAVSIEGIGGIGKTSIAQNLFRHLHKNSYFDGYTWISARQKELSLSGEIAPVNNFVSTLDDVIARLAHELGQTHLAGLSTQKKLQGIKTVVDKNRLLIIIDNLETIEEIEQLIPELLNLAGFSKLLFTSRKSLSQYSAIRTFPVPELSPENSRLLVLNEISRRGLSLTISDQTMAELYQVSGGVPLALKLAASQFGLSPAEEIIENLRNGKNNSQNLYIYIYRQAWQFLDDAAKRLLLSMLLVSPDGEDRQWICEIGELSVADFNHGLEQLKRLSLIELSGTIEIPRYSIHRLTTTFLQSDILQSWGNQNAS